MVKALPSSQKLRGGYYTPEPIARFLAAWAIQSDRAHVLEPSCGDGALLATAVDALLALGCEQKDLSEMVCGVEYDATEAQVARKRLRDHGVPQTHGIVHSGDFFAYCRDQLFEMDITGAFAPRRSFDAIIGNPPFIRYQNFPEIHRSLAFEFMRQYGFHPNKLTNIWVPFLIISAFLLNDRGRLAFVIPAELFQVNYAAEARQFLSDFFSNITLITFKKLVFDDIQQEVILLLAEREQSDHHDIRVVELDDIADLEEYARNSRPVLPPKPMDHTTEKWTQYFLDGEEIALLRRLRHDHRLTLSGSVLDVDVGVVTGQNDFFLLTKEQVMQKELHVNTDRVVSRSNHLEGVIFREADWASNAQKQLPSYLLKLPKVAPNLLSQSAHAYIQAGENAKLHTGYKCKIRTPWYSVPSIWIPDAFMLRQVHAYPKLILNRAQATCTDTVHRVRFRQKRKNEVVVAAFMNSLTFAFAEVTGRSYGGGVLTFEPSEAERLPIPLIGADQLNVAELDIVLRQQGIAAVLAITDQVLLLDGLGLTQREVGMLRQIWVKLRDRRINRK